MKIDEKKSKSVNPYATKVLKKREGVGKITESFSDYLHDSNREYIRKELEEMLKDIDEFGGKLISEPSIENALSYKASVAGFLDKVIKNIYLVKTTGTISPLKVVDTVNLELEHLMQYIMDKQSKSIDAAAKIDNIKGLLVNLLF